MTISAYDLLPGYLRVFLVRSDGQRDHELDIDLSLATVEPLSLPNMPFCLKIKPNVGDGLVPAITMEATSPIQQETWLQAIVREIEATKA
jgi:hypothetical protein